MATNYPNSLDSLTNPTTTDPVNNPSHAVQHANANDAIEALQAKVGTNNSAVATSLDYRVRQLEANPVGTANKITQLVINNTGSTLAKGKVVYASGSVGASGQLRVSLSSNAAESTSSKTFGVLAEQIIQGGQGTVVCEGLLENIDTTGANDGDPIWLGTNGSMIFGLVNKPVAPAHLVFVGIVVRGGNANNGSIFVKVQNGFELDELHTVLLSSLADKDLLAYDSATGLWKNKTFTTLDIPTKTYVDTALSNLSNTVTTDYVPISDVGQPDGVASLDSTGKIPLAQMGNLVAGAPTALDTLNELAAALGNNPNYATDITTALGTKVSKNGGDTITVSSASTKGLAIRSVASQTANLQEWQNQYGSVVAKIDNEAIFNSLNAGSGPDSYSSIVIGNRWIRNEQRSALTKFGVNTGEWHMASNPDNSVIAITDNQVGVFGVSATLPTFTVKAAASQTANLTEWQNSNGSIIARIDSGGIRWGNSTLSSAYGQLFLRDATDYGGAANINTGFAGTKGIVIRGYASQTANLQEWQNSSGTVLASIASTGQINAGAGFYTDWAGVGTGRIGAAHLSVSSQYLGNIVSIFKGVSGQTANLTEWQNSSGAILASVSAGGDLTIPSARVAIGITAPISLVMLGTVAAGATFIPIVAKGAASQTANLQEWQNSSGTILAKVDKDGNIGIGAGTNALSAGLDVFTGSIRVWNGVTGSGQTGTIYLGDGSFSKTYGSGWTFNGGITTNNEIYITGGTLRLGDGYLTKTPGNPFIINSNFWVNGSYLTVGGSNINYNNSLTVYSGSSTRVGAVIQGASSQTANLQEWQNSAGTVLAKINASGSLNFSQPSAISEPIIDISIPAFHVHPGVLTRSGTAWITALNPTGLDSYWQGRFYSRDTATVALWVKGKASQTANLTEWQNDAGTVLAAVSNIGTIRSNIFANLTSGLTYIATNFDTSGIGIVTSSADQKGLIVRGAASQTADLQQWQNSAGTVLAKITSTGAFDATAITVNGQPIPTGLTSSAVSSNITLSSNYKYFVDTTAVRTLTLPASPVLGDEIQIFDASNSAGTNNVTINSNSGKINGSVQNAIIDVNGAAVSFVYTGSTYGWRMG